jgi:hypothetical protein
MKEVNQESILKMLSKQYKGNVVFYERLGNNGLSVYYSRVEIFNGPLFVFHLLRRLAIFLDQSADFIRTIIRKMTRIV